MSEKLSPKLINKLNEILGKMELEATEDYLNDLLEGSYAKKSMIEIDGIDTAEREMFYELLAQKLTGMEWPYNMDSKEKNDNFLKAFMKAVSEEEGLSWIEVKKTV